MIHQWEIWKAKVPGFQSDHWFVLASSQERMANGQRPTTPNIRQPT